MSDSEVEPQTFNYTNCIITRHEASDDSFTSVLTPSDNELNENSQPDNENSDLTVSCEQIEDADLSPEEWYFFMLGMLIRVEKYLDNLNEDDHKQFLTTHISLIKTALNKNSNHFHKNDVNINEKTPEVQKNTRKKKQALVTKTQPKTRTQDKLCDSNLLKPLGIETPSQVETPGTESGVRRSNRLQEFAKDRELVYCDRMSYISLKLLSSTPLPKIVKRRVKGEIVESKFLLSQPQIKKKNTTLRLKSVTTAKNKKEKIAKATKKNNRTMIERGSKAESPSKKRRAVSMGGGYNKKAKKSEEVTVDSLPETMSPNCGSTSTSSVGKRKLYTPESWLHTMHQMQLHLDDNFEK